ncbi:hypothetical protein ABT010_40600 [Streptomyces sp. NPDC002668]|uniref:hypothetical protein n=1 Tax=Streptomyces sp. NPDC002668 TaxID=3154422 RepID=UPI0033165E0A
MTGQPALQPGPWMAPGGCFRADESVFGPASGLLEGVAVPVFGDLVEWPGTCVRRPANLSPGNW